MGVYGSPPKRDADLIDDREDPQDASISCQEDPVSVQCTGGFGGGPKGGGGPGDTRVFGRLDNTLGVRPEMAGPVHTPGDLAGAFGYMYGSSSPGDRTSNVWAPRRVSSWQYPPPEEGRGEGDGGGYDATATWDGVPAGCGPGCSSLDQAALGRALSRGGAAGLAGGGGGGRARGGGGAAGAEGGGKGGQELREVRASVGDVEALRRAIGQIAERLRDLKQGGGSGG